MLKLTKSEGANYPTGWHTVTIDRADDGKFDESRYIDLFFKDHPENLKCRVWSAVNGTTGEDFGIGNLFHYANAGITSSDDGTVSIDDNVRHLHGKTLNVLFYSNAGGYTDAAQRVVPTVQDTEHVSFSESHVENLKAKAEAWVARRLNGSAPSLNGVTKTVTEEEAVPF